MNQNEYKMHSLIDMMSESDQLEHYGIKGMKWGIRRTPEQLGHKKPRHKGAKENEERYSELAKELDTPSKKALVKDLKKAAKKVKPMYRKYFWETAHPYFKKSIPQYELVRDEIRKRMSNWENLSRSKGENLFLDTAAYAEKMSRKILGDISDTEVGHPDHKFYLYDLLADDLVYLYEME